jgi:transposase
MSKPVERVEIITGRERRRRYTAEEKVRLVEETMQPGMTVSSVARLHGVSPSLLFGWRRRMAEGGLEAVRADEGVVPASRVRELEATPRPSPSRSSARSPSSRASPCSPDAG